jgi:AraC-like DNA-binding protein
MVRFPAQDIIAFIRDLVDLLRPFARVNSIELKFETPETRLLTSFQPDGLMADISRLVCQIIPYLPEEQTITIAAILEKADQEKQLTIRIRNTGMDLSRVNEITRGCSQRVEVNANNEKRETSFSFTVPVTIPDLQVETKERPSLTIGNTIIPEYYNEIRKRLLSHFSKAENLVAQLSILYPKEAVFLQKVNTVIIAHLENEFFNTEVLSTEMNMSRTQLFRRLKPLIRQAPAAYIKSIRLQKAKELLESTDITVGDAAFRTGFQSPSHFTKAFSETFGFRPSDIKRRDQQVTKDQHATNE